MSFDENLASRLRRLFEGNLDIREIKMFGGLCFTSRGHMFIGIVGNNLMARIGPDNYSLALQQPHVREMDFTGKPMQGYVFIAPDGIATEQSLAKWSDLCLRFIDTLPPKK
jgi:hypothetical protein